MDITLFYRELYILVNIQHPTTMLGYIIDFISIHSFDADTL